jgi:DNA transformation protein
MLRRRRGWLMPRLSELPNIGPELEKQLMAVGINTPEELREVGSCEAWLRILRQDPSACMMRLSALKPFFWYISR